MVFSSVENLNDIEGTPLLEPYSYEFTELTTRSCDKGLPNHHIYDEKMNESFCNVHKLLLANMESL